MIIAVLQFELLIHGAESLKDKRRVVKSAKDRLHRDHLVSVAEVAALENASLAVMALSLVGREAGPMARTLDRITEKLRRLGTAELGDVQRAMIPGIPSDENTATRVDEAAAAALEAELAAYAADAVDATRDEDNARGYDRQ